MKWVVDEKAHWWNGKLMKCPGIKKSWWKFKLIKMQVDEMIQPKKLTKIQTIKMQVDEMARWPSAKV